MIDRRSHPALAFFQTFPHPDKLFNAHISFIPQNEESEPLFDMQACAKRFGNMFKLKAHSLVYYLLGNEHPPSNEAGKER